MTATRTTTRKPATTTGSQGPWQLTLDGRVTAVCVALLEGGAAHSSSLGWAPQARMSATARVLHERGLPNANGRHPAGRQQVACYAAVYGRTFALTWPWEPAPAPDGLLRWTHAETGRLLLDQPRATHAHASLITEEATRAVATGQTDPLFVGVRVLPLAAPVAARLLLPTGQLTALPDLHDTTPTFALAFAG